MAEKTGPRGPKGAHGRRGERGRAGHRGARGKTGPRGERGPSGAVPSRSEILAVVEEQLAEIRQQLEIQLTRIAQLQAQLDHVQSLLKHLVQESA